MIEAMNPIHKVKERVSGYPMQATYQILAFPAQQQS
jgi:hypothetical protein